MYAAKYTCSYSCECSKKAREQLCTQPLVCMSEPCGWLKLSSWPTQKFPPVQKNPIVASTTSWCKKRVRMFMSLSFTVLNRMPPDRLPRRQGGIKFLLMRVNAPCGWVEIKQLASLQISPSREKTHCFLYDILVQKVIKCVYIPFFYSSK